MPKWISKTTLFLTLISLLGPSLISAQMTKEAASLASTFKAPPNSTKPRTWMHSMSANSSKAGMTKDLEAIAAAGEGGVLLFDVSHGIPYGKSAYDSPKHHEIIKHAAKECERLDLSFGVHNCDGWSSSGGPWIKPEESMRMIVHRDTLLNLTGSQFRVRLPQPTTREDYYKDIAVLAYPTLDAEVIDAAVEPVITSSDPKFDITLVTDERAERTARLGKPGDEDPWIQYDYGQPHTVRAVHVVHTQRRAQGTLETSDDGENFTAVKKLFKVRTEKSEHRFMNSFEPITARYFRIRFSETMRIKEIDLSAVHLVNNYVGLSGRGYTSTSKLDMIAAPEPSMVIKKDDIVNLTKYLNNDGSLEASLPAGQWTIMRFGVTSMSVKNSPASQWGRGLECDKFSRPAFKKHWDNFVQEVIDNTRAVAPNALQYIEIDSYEMGGQNWTDGFAEIYQREKGYDLIEYLPLFAGRYVEDLNTTKRVLWDLNDLVCDLMTKNYFEYFTELCNENGVLSYIEPYGKGHVNQFDVTGVTDLPMTEFWMDRKHGYVPSIVSGAHIYGKNIISAESFTSGKNLNWKMHPAMAKDDGDKAWAEGINEFMFHRFAHQANTHVKPGMTMSQWGSHIDRTQTWWMNAGKAWFKYISRGSHLLRQGYPVVDVLVFAGDVSHNSDVLPDDLNPTLPAGVNYDCTNADVLINRIKLADGKMLLPEGNAYSHLILQNVDYIDLSTLKRIKEIADAGVIITGDMPKSLAGYINSKDREEAFSTLIDHLGKSPNFKKDYNFDDLQPDLHLVDRDQLFAHRRTEKEDIYFFYNETDDLENYEAVFRVENKIPELWNAETGEISKLAQFRSEENGTRVWMTLKPRESAFVVFRDAADGVDQIVKPDYTGAYKLNDDNKIVAITRQNGKKTVQLRNGNVATIETKGLPKDIDISTDWQVEFLKEHDFSARKTFSSLSDWKDHAEKGIKYYSGTAIYSKVVNLERYKANTNVILDLGEVSIVAEVFVNDQPVEVLWKAPFTCDITNYLEKGVNTITVNVTNQWTNRLIGDEEYPVQDGGYTSVTGGPQPEDLMPDWYVNNEPMPAGPRTTFTTMPFYKKGDPLISSGLLGPVKIIFEREAIVK